MPKTTFSQDERQLVKLVEKLPLAQEEKSAWVERIRNGEMSEELAEEIRQKITAHNDENEQAAAVRTRYLVELTMLVKRWRMSSQAQNFRKH